MTAFPAFEVTIPGKWVLSGEHSVLRGARAVALPHPEFRLNLRFKTGGERFETAPPEARELAIALVEGVFRISGKTAPELSPGLLEIQSTIPFGAGLGSSAALCSAIVRWLAPVAGIPSEEIREVATRLEDRFHGRSSGMDVAVTSEERPIVFQNTGGERKVELLPLEKMPKFSFHDTGLRKKTSECIARVERFHAENPQRGSELDDRMGRASVLAEEGLRLFSQAGDEKGRASALESIKSAMETGQSCFREWDLMPESATEIERALRKRGALSVKLTGAGGGGFLVALWL